MWTSRSLRLFIVGLALLGLAPTAIAMPQWYVDGAYGSDTTGTGTSWGTAYRSIGKVLTVLADSGNVWCRNLNSRNPGDTLSANNIDLSANNHNQYNGSKTARITFIGKLDGQNWAQADTLAYRIGLVHFGARSYVTVKGFSVRSSGPMQGVCPTCTGVFTANQFARRGIGDSLAYCRLDGGILIEGAVQAVIAHNSLGLQQKRAQFLVHGEGGARDCGALGDHTPDCPTKVYNTIQVAFADSIIGNLMWLFADQGSQTAAFRVAGMAQGIVIDSNTVSVLHQNHGTDGQDAIGLSFQESSLPAPGIPNYVRYNMWRDSAATNYVSAAWAPVKLRSHASNNRFSHNIWHWGDDPVSSQWRWVALLSATAGDTTSATGCGCSGGGNDLLWEPDQNTWDYDTFYLGPNSFMQWQSSQISGHFNNCTVIAQTLPSPDFPYAISFTSSFPVNSFDWNSDTFIGHGKLIGWSDGMFPNFHFRDCLFYSDSLVSGSVLTGQTSGQFSIKNCLFNLQGKGGTLTTETACLPGSYTGMYLNQANAASGGSVGYNCRFVDPLFLNRDLNHGNMTGIFRLQGPQPAVGSFWDNGTCVPGFVYPPCYVGAVAPSDSIRPGPCAITKCEADSSNIHKYLTWTDSADDSTGILADSVFICELPGAYPPSDPKLSSDPTSTYYWRNWVIAGYKQYATNQTYSIDWSMSGFVGTTPAPMTFKVYGSSGPASQTVVGTGGSDAVFTDGSGHYGIGNYCVITKSWDGNTNAVSSTYMNLLNYP